MSWSVIAKATGHGYECVVTLSDIEDRPDFVQEDAAKLSARNTFRHFFMQEPEVIGVCIRPQ